MIWLPRPFDNGRRFQMLLSDFAIDSVCLPLVKIEYMNVDVNALKNISSFIFTSRYSVSGLAGQHSIIKNKNVIAIGPGTSDSLRQLEFKRVQTVLPPYNSKSFVENDHLYELNGTVGLVCGEAGREEILKHLVAKKINVVTVPVYRRTIPDISEKTMLKFLYKHSIDSVVITSESILNSLINFGVLVQAYLMKIIFFVNSERVARRCRDYGYEPVVVSENASNAALLDCIQHYFRELK